MVVAGRYAATSMSLEQQHDHARSMKGCAAPICELESCDNSDSIPAPLTIHFEPILRGRARSIRHRHSTGSLKSLARGGASAVSMPGADTFRVGHQI